MRLTYRTVRVLMVIGEHPGASNREIAEGAGIADQGQISKLLTASRGSSSSRTAATARSKGAANAWHLTRARRRGRARHAPR